MFFLSNAHQIAYDMYSRLYKTNNSKYWLMNEIGECKDRIYLFMISWGLIDVDFKLGLHFQQAHSA